MDAEEFVYQCAAMLRRPVYGPLGHRHEGFTLVRCTQSAVVPGKGAFCREHRIDFMDSEERLAAAAHDAWLAEKRRRGVTSWPNEAGVEQMVPYAHLDESIREFDRVVVRALLAEMGLVVRVD